MPLVRRTLLLSVLATLALAPCFTAPSFAASTVIKVSLWDKGAEMDMMTGLGMGMNGNMKMATMGIKATPNKVKAGDVTFDVRNDSKDTIHEMIVAPVADPTKPLPYNESESRVEEDEAGDLGEVSELDPGASGKLTVPMKPGTYILYCNVPGHYASGMWTLITVEP